MVGDISLQTPNVEYSSTSIKKEFAVWLYFSFYFVQQLPILQIANKYNILWAHINLQYLQSPVDGGQTIQGKVITRRKMEDKGQVTDDIAAAHATSTESPSSNSVDAQSSNNGTSICQDVLTMHDTGFQSTFYPFSELLFFPFVFLFSCCKFSFVFYVCQIVSIKVWKHVTKVLINLSVNFG